ncbi:DUF1800 family protein [Sphingomonas sp. 28-62-11]|uniref:DUF1800 domain-containing protein n=1 Tax=Sphingomonas sp. 28-62-11 TaxID=1970432 RepID=UPI000BD424F5|nr:MAG: hypothetical protein B7Y49_04855 [Sphingomonas sp. 28-62-11]
MSAPSIALNRFGLGARPDEAPPGASASAAQAWLTAQFTRFDPRPAPIAALPGRQVIAGQLADYLAGPRPMGNNAMRTPTAASPMAEAGPDMAGAMAAMRPGAAESPDEPEPIKRARMFLRTQGRENYVGCVGARANAALLSPAPFIERMVHFWANHFAISADKLTVIGLGGYLELEAIRPHVLGRFGDMLNAVERHPAMLLYLDQAQSIGPASPIGARIAERGQRKVGINENLAREIMELHTLGVRTGYAQADVTEFARAMTGWTVAGINRGPIARFAGANGAPGDFAFAAALHEPGTRTIMGKTYPQQGEAQAQAVLNDLAMHPATAQHIATKLARHFAGDTPPATLVARLKDAFLKSGGDLPTLYRTLIAAPELWGDAPTKFRSPWEWSIASLRAIGARDVPALQVTGLTNQLGQPTWRPGSPAGFDDVTATWAGADAIMRRVEAAERFAARTGGTVDARVLAPKLFPGALSSATQAALANADSPGQALALLLVAPEFLRR